MNRWVPALRGDERDETWGRETAAATPHPIPTFARRSLYDSLLETMETIEKVMLA